MISQEKILTTVTVAAALVDKVPDEAVLREVAAKI